MQEEQSEHAPPATELNTCQQGFTHVCTCPKQSVESQDAIARV